MDKPDWKADIIALTEHPFARENKIDASFFPPVKESDVLSWESQCGQSLPAEFRSYLLQSNGLEARRGEWWPILPIEEWEVLDDLCVYPAPMIRFGKLGSAFSLLSLGHSPSIYRQEEFAKGDTYLARSLSAYLQKVFSGTE